MEAYFWLVKNFAWIMIGLLLIRRPIREFAAAAQANSPAQLSAAKTTGSPRHKTWMIIRLLAGLYCVVVSFYNLISSLVLYHRAH